MGRSLFSSQRCASLGKLKFCQNRIFHKTWVQKGSLYDQENHLRLKNFFIREFLMKSKLHHTCLTQVLTFVGGSPFFKPKIYLFGKIEILSKSCFFIKHEFKKAPS